MPVCPVCGKDNPAGFEFCGYCGASLAGAATRVEERKLVTMLFADLIGSTDLASRLDVERLRSILQGYFSAMASVIESWGGTVEKYIGDAIMAVFGVPALREDDAERAVRAAIEMLERLRELNEDFRRRHAVTLQVRIGLNTGEVIAPVGGQTLVAGDAVNVAARLQAAARPGAILVGERTHAATRRAFRYDGPIALELKGKEGAVDAYEVLGGEPGTWGARGAGGLTAEMVGRDREIDSLVHALEVVTETGRPGMVLVVGQAGIGKSRLVAEFLQSAATEHPTLSVTRGRCPAAGHGITYWALGEILRSAFGIALDDPPEAAGEKLRGGVGEALSILGLPRDEVASTTSALATTAGITLDDNPLDRLEPQEVGERLARAWPRLVTALAARGPLLLAFEDLHWADDLLLEMVLRLVAQSTGPVLLVGTARPELTQTHPQLGAHAGVSTLWLEPLSEADSAELVARFLSETELPVALRAGIVDRAEGNPLFLEEMLNGLIDEGALVREGDHWRTSPGVASTPLPDTVHALLAARLDALPTEEKRVLQEASVVGRTFWEEPVAQALGAGDVSGPLIELQRKGFLQAQPTSSLAAHTEFQFKHALIRDVAYASLPRTRRARAHAGHGAWMEALAGDRGEAWAELIAHQYASAAAGETDLAWFDQPAEREAVERKAFAWLLVAGRLARRRYAVERALGLHGQAAGLARTPTARAAALEALGDDHDAVVHGDGALSAYRQGISILREEPDDDEARGRICMKAARMILEKSGAFSEPQDPALIDELVDEGRACTTDGETLAWLEALWGATAVWWIAAGADRATLDERIESLSRSLAVARSLALPELEAFAQEYLCEAFMLRVAFGEVSELSRRTEVFDRIESIAGRSLGLVEVGIWAMDVAGDAERALGLLTRAHELARDLSPHDLMHATGFVIHVLYHMGRWQQLDAVLDEHVAAFREEADATCELLHGGVLAGATRLAHGGDLHGARELAEMAPPFPSTDPMWAGYATVWRARFSVAVGEALTGLRHAEQVLATTRPWTRFQAATVTLDALADTGDRDALAAFLPTARGLDGGLAALPATCDRAEAYLAQAAGDVPTARRLLDRALQGFERLGVPFEAARTREALAAVSPSPVAGAALAGALDTYERLGATPAATRVRAALEATIGRGVG